MSRVAYLVRCACFRRPDGNRRSGANRSRLLRCGGHGTPTGRQADAPRGQAESIQEFQVICKPFDRLNVDGVQNVGSAFLYQTWYVRTSPTLSSPRMDTDISPAAGYCEAPDEFAF